MYVFMLTSIQINLDQNNMNTASETKSKIYEEDSEDSEESDIPIDTIKELYT